MAQVSLTLRRGSQHFAHWCPGCDDVHVLPDHGWTFNGDLQAPSFTPSFKHTWDVLEDGKEAHRVCHYVLTDGQLEFCGDCTHALAGKVVPLPPWPAELSDWIDG